MTVPRSNQKQCGADAGKGYSMGLKSTSTHDHPVI
jgi:hypothetical protein